SSRFPTFHLYCLACCYSCVSAYFPHGTCPASVFGTRTPNLKPRKAKLASPTRLAAISDRCLQTSPHFSFVKHIKCLLSSADPSTPPMRLLVQRVSRASVHINQQQHSEIQQGLLIFVGIESGDTIEDA